MPESKLPAVRRERRAGRLPLWAALAATGWLACVEPAPPAPDAHWPPGTLLSARSDALGPLLAELEGIEDTPLARAARRLREALPACAEVEAIASEPAGLADALRCADVPGALAGLHTYRGGAVAALALPLGEPTAPRLLLRADRSAAGLALDVRLSSADAEAPLAALLPGAVPPGAGVLSDRERLLHVRVRVDGTLDLASLVTPGSQADLLFRLRGELLSAAVLDGTWEAALYPPARGAGMPRVVIALGIRHQGAAIAAAERLLDDVESHWSVSRTPLVSGTDAGACLLDLRLLPELAPCYVATEHALVLSWNPASLRQALEPEAREPEGAADDTGGRLEIDLARLRETDLRLARRIGPNAVAAVASWPWQRLVATGERRDAAYAFRVALESGPRRELDASRQP